MPVYLRGNLRLPPNVSKGKEPFFMVYCHLDHEYHPRNLLEFIFLWCRIHIHVNWTFTRHDRVQGSACCMVPGVSVKACHQMAVICGVPGSPSQPFALQFLKLFFEIFPFGFGWWKRWRENEESIVYCLSLGNMTRKHFKSKLMDISMLSNPKKTKHHGPYIGTPQSSDFGLLGIGRSCKEKNLRDMLVPRRGNLSDQASGLKKNFIYEGIHFPQELGWCAMIWNCGSFLLPMRYFN